MAGIRSKTAEEAERIRAQWRRRSRQYRRMKRLREQLDKQK